MTITLGENGSANQLRADLASTASTALGDALVGVKSTLTGGVPRTQHQKNADVISVADFGASPSETAANNTTFIQAAVTSALGRTLYIPAGNYNINGTIDLPQSIRIVGESRRGMGNYPGTTQGSVINAQFAGPALRKSYVSQTSVDITLEHIEVTGNYSAYGAGTGVTGDGSGVYFKNAPGVTMDHMVVAGFGRSQIFHDTGCYSGRIKDVYVAETYGLGGSQANIRINGEFFELDGIESDNGTYSIYLDTAAHDTRITGGVLEGALTSVIFIGAIGGIGAVTVLNTRINNSFSGSGIICNAAYCHFAHNRLRCSAVAAGSFVVGVSYRITSAGTTDFTTIGAANSNVGTTFTATGAGSGTGAASIAGTYGIRTTSPGYATSCVDNDIFGYDEAISEDNAGYNRFIGNSANANVKGMVVTSASYMSLVEGNKIAGGTDSLYHSSGNNAIYSGNDYRNANTDAYLVPTVAAGRPRTDFFTAIPSVAVTGANQTINAMGVPIFSVSGTGSLQTLAPPWTGFYGSVTLIPTGAFTTVTGGNIKIASTAVVDKALVMTWDGTDWYPNDAYQGTVTSVAALTLGTTGTDLSSTVATGTTTPVITLQVPTASAANRGVLSTTDWSAFSGKYTPGTALTATTVSGTQYLASGPICQYALNRRDTNTLAWTLYCPQGDLRFYNSAGLEPVIITQTGAVTVSTIKATSAGGYISSDGSTGYTGTVTTASLVGKTLTIKDGIIVGFA